MNIQFITVEIHEKRNHPNAYGHYDAKVAYTAQLQEGEGAEDITKMLRNQARRHVLEELDDWIESIELERNREDARADLYWILSRAEHGRPDADDAQDFETRVASLPESEQAEYRAKLEAANLEVLTPVRNELEKYIMRAKTYGELTEREEAHFYSMLDRLPEAERDGHLVNLDAALAGHRKVEVTK